MRALGVVFVLAGLLLIGGAGFVHVKTSGLGAVPAEVIALERSLARPGLLALATVDVAGLRELGVLDDTSPDQGLAGDLSRAGIDPGRDLSHVTLAVSADPAAAKGTQVALALFGRFDPAKIEAALREDGNASVREDPANPGGLLLTRIDRETCAESGPWALHLAPDRVLMADPTVLPALVDGTAPRSEGALRDLSRFQAFRAGQLVSAALFVPDELPDTGNPLVGMAAYGAKQQVEGFRAIYAGAAPRLVPPGLAVEALLEGVAPGAAAARAQAWQSWLDEKLGAASEQVPTLATLHEALDLRTEGNDLHASFRLAQADLEELRKLPGELGSLVFAGASGFDLAPGGVQEERLAESPHRFQEQVSKAEIDAYDPSVTFAEPVDATAGPVGVRIAAVRIPQRSDGSERREIEIEAFATGVPNLGDASDRVSLLITGVEGRGGEALLAKEHCGPDRNELPVQLSNHFGGEVLKGAKAVRLREGSEPEDVARIAGEVVLRLPTRTERVELAAAPGEVERAGARLAIRGVKGSSVSYEVSGEADALLQLRATNAKGQVLAEDSRSAVGGSGRRSVSVLFAGEVQGVEAIFALEEVEVRYAFALEGAVPGTSGETLANEVPAPDAGAVAVAGALEDWLARVARPLGDAALKLTGASPVEAATRAGPFAVRLGGIWTFGGLMPRIEVEAPDVPGLADAPSAVELRLRELHRTDGSVERGSWSETLRMSQGWGRSEGLVGSSQIETGVEGRAQDVASLRGEVRVRLPVRVRSETLPGVELGDGLDAPDLAVRLVERGRDRFVLRAARGAERLLGAQAYNAEGAPLWTTPGDVEATDAGALELAFQARGVPARIDLRVADELAEAAYPFVLDTGDRKLASAR